MAVGVNVVVGVEAEGGEVLGVEGGLEMGGEFLEVFQVLGGLWREEWGVIGGKRGKK